MPMEIKWVFQRIWNEMSLCQRIWNEMSLCQQNKMSLCQRKWNEYMSTKIKWVYVNEIKLV